MSKSDFRVCKSKYINEKLINAFLAKLEQKIGVEGFIIFGSRATGEALIDSDYDIAVISDDFNNMSKFERIFLSLDNWQYDLPLEPVAYTVKEFKVARGLLIWDILEDGIIIKDTGVIANRRTVHNEEKKHGHLKKVEGGWQF